VASTVSSVVVGAQCSPVETLWYWEEGTATWSSTQLIRVDEKLGLPCESRRGGGSTPASRCAPAHSPRQMYLESSLTHVGCVTFRLAAASLMWTGAGVFPRSACIFSEHHSCVKPFDTRFACPGSLVANPQQVAATAMKTLRIAIY
jgi:hypothetical protein